ncbi:MAG: sulfatase-like hydrolase/transferase [Myxococcota bacterium]
MPSTTALTPLLLLALAGCWGDSPTPAPSKNGAAANADDQVSRAEMRQKRQERAERRRNASEARPKGQPGVQNVIFVVMDTVRSESLSLCDYDRPTSPFLEHLKNKTGAATTCRAYSPGTWTIPSHASYFTSLDVPAHGVSSMGRVFGNDTPVLSEMMSDQGYQTVMVSANPTLSRRSGLQRGFEYARTAKNLTELRGEKTVRAVNKLLKNLSPREPLFLFVNLIDAHDPYPAVPNNISWVPERPELKFDVHRATLDTPYHRYIKGEMEEEEAEAYLAAITDGYDYGISLADKNLEGLMEYLRGEGWLKNGFRLIITSDHGEFLGEHQLLRHGCYTHEPVVNVPFVFYDSEAETQIELPEPFSATNAFYLARDGKLPTSPTPVSSFSMRRKLDVKKGADMATLWHDDEKVFWREGDLLRVDLNEDPGELRPEALGDHRLKEDVVALGERHTAHLRSGANQAEDAQRRAELEALGYVE